MKNIKYFLSAVFVIATLAGCGSKWQQDPLSDKDGAFKNGQQKPTLPESPKPISSESVRLDTVDQYTFREGTPGEITMSARVLEAGYTPTIFIDNMNDFPGAAFNTSTGKFTWTPPMGTVNGDQGLEEKRPLSVHVVGNNPNGKVLSGTFKVDLRIGKQVNTPEIFSVSKTSATMREGDMMTVQVKVRDKDAGSSAASYPNLQVLPITGYGNISQYVTITQVLATGNNEFVINLSVDLSDAELTKSRDRFGFMLKAISRFQQASTAQNVLIDVATSFAPLQSTWFDVLSVPVGVKTNFQFMIFDPKDETFVGTPTFTNVPNGATITCNGVSVTRQFCTFSWSPDFTVSPGDYTINAVATAKNQDAQDTFSKDNTFQLKLTVTSAPPVSPVSVKGGN